MSIISAVQQFQMAKFVIPFPGKMQHSTIAKSNQALCFCINKGYFDVQDPDTLRSIIEDIDETNGKVMRVGDVDTVRVNGGITYRQRIFCKSFRLLLNVCKLNGATIVLDDNFEVTINSIMNCISDLKFLEHYAKKYGELIDTWLSNCLIIHINSLLVGMSMYTKYQSRVDDILKNKVGYCDRAPFLLSEFNWDEHKSSVFMNLDNEDIRIFSTNVGDDYYKVYGFTTDNVTRDLKEGVFRDKK